MPQRRVLRGRITLRFVRLHPGFREAPLARAPTRAGLTRRFMFFCLAVLDLERAGALGRALACRGPVTRPARPSLSEVRPTGPLTMLWMAERLKVMVPELVFRITLPP